MLEGCEMFRFDTFQQEKLQMPCHPFGDPNHLKPLAASAEYKKSRAQFVVLSAFLDLETEAEGKAKERFGARL